jgi:hypothetical protein
VATKKKVAKKKVVKKKAKKKKIAKKKVANKTTKKKTVKKATPKRKPVVKRSNESIKTSTSVKSTHQSPTKDSIRTVAEIKSNVEKPTEDVMAEEIYGEGSPAHQTPANEKVFQDVLKRLCTDPAFRKSVIDVPEVIEVFKLSPEQQLTLIAVGHASGKYTYKPGEGFCCCCG